MIVLLGVVAVLVVGGGLVYLARDWIRDVVDRWSVK